VTGYEPYIHWICLRCGAEGALSRPAAEDSLRTSLRISEAHAELAPLCAGEYGSTRISLHQETGALPE
jgi:hypothetical protein